jgi:hypothetical protein
MYALSTSACGKKSALRTLALQIARQRCAKRSDLLHSAHESVIFLNFFGLGGSSREPEAKGTEASALGSTASCPLLDGRAPSIERLGMALPFPLSLDSVGEEDMNLSCDAGRRGVPPVSCKGQRVHKRRRTSNKWKRTPSQSESGSRNWADHVQSHQFALGSRLAGEKKGKEYTIRPKRK